jgi:peptidoglycan/LPS O-acetylase OafA/YrhL
VVALTLAWLVCFAGTYALQLKKEISSGSNITPFYLSLRQENLNVAEDKYRVLVVTPWSTTELKHRDFFWEFPNGDYRSVPQIALIPTDVDLPQPTCAIFTELPSEARDNGYKYIELKQTTFEGRKTFEASPSAYPNSLVLLFLKRKCLNWGGDLNLFVQAAKVPLLQTLPILILCILLTRIWLFSSPNHLPNQAKSTQTLHLSGLDELRGLAILAVFLYHILYASFGFDQLGWSGDFRKLDHPISFLVLSPLTFGHGGVAIFFAVSGFCVHLSYSRSKVKSWRDYFCKRFFRIYPPYFIALLFFAFAFPITCIDLQQSYNQSRYLTRLFLCSNFYETTYWGINGSFWSIAVEAQLYVLYPLILFCVSLLGWRLTLTVLFALEVFSSSSFVGSYFTPESYFAIRFGPLAYVFSWAIGAELASAYLQQKTSLFRHIPISLTILFLVGSLFYKPLENCQFLAFALFGVKLIDYVIQYDHLPFPNPIRFHLAFLGTISYSMYLLHQPFINLSAEITKRLSFIDSPPARVFACLATYPVILVISWYFYKFVELPSIKLGQDLLTTSNTSNTGVAKTST